jgi:hypothetical protein
MRTLIQPQWHLIEGYRPYKQPNGHGSTRKNTEYTLFFRVFRVIPWLVITLGA